MKEISKKVKQRGITLIALVITIIVLLILAGVTIATLTGENGILTRATEAKQKSEKSQAEEEVGLAIGNLKIEESQKEMTQEEKRKVLEDELKKFENSSTVSTNGTGFLAKHRGYDFRIDSSYNISVTESFDAEEWDKTAAPEDVFIWQSDDPNNEGYGVVVGYTANVDNYPILRYPSRCTKIDAGEWTDDRGDNDLARSYTNNIKKIEIPRTVSEIGSYAFGGYYLFNNVDIIIIPESVTKMGSDVFAGWSYLQTINCKSTSMPSGWNNNWKGNAVVIWGEDDFDSEEWDKTAAPEDVFIWQSDDPNEEGYGVIKGYNSSIQNYSVLRYPSRCKRISYINNMTTEERSFVKNIKKIELPNTVRIIDSNAYDTRYLYFNQLIEINIPEYTVEIGMGAFKGCENLTKITYKGNEYTSKSTLITMLKNNGVYLYNESSIFENTGLSE